MYVCCISALNCFICQSGVYCDVCLLHLCSELLYCQSGVYCDMFFGICAQNCFIVSQECIVIFWSFFTSVHRIALFFVRSVL